MERGWVGRVDGDKVVQLAAQTLQSLFTGGGTAREHAVYPLDAVRLLAPVLHPPSIRLFDDDGSFAFANPAAVVGPGACISPPGTSPSQARLELRPRVAAIVGTEGAIAAFTILAEWRDPEQTPPKDRDFALGLGPVAVSSYDAEWMRTLRVDGEEISRGTIGSFDWQAATALAARATTLFPGDLLAAPRFTHVTHIVPGHAVEIEVDGIGVLEHGVAG